MGAVKRNLGIFEWCWVRCQCPCTGLQLKQAKFRRETAFDIFQRLTSKPNIISGNNKLETDFRAEKNKRVIRTSPTNARDGLTKFDISSKFWKLPLTMKMEIVIFCPSFVIFYYSIDLWLTIYQIWINFMYLCHMIIFQF